MNSLSTTSLKRSAWILAIVSLLFANSGQAQLTVAGTPPSWELSATQQKSMGAVPSIRLAAQNNEALLKAAQLETPFKSLRFGEPVMLSAKSSSTGQWSTLPSGERLWRLRISSPTAENLSVFFKKFKLPKRAVLYAYTDDREYFSGAITSLNNQADGLLYLAPLPADALTLEVAVAAEDEAKLEMEIGHVVHGFRSLPISRSLSSFGRAGSCHIDAACTAAQVYPDAQRAVGVILFSNGANCTGSLINNTSVDGRPLFLSADHCDESFNSNQVAHAVLFNYKRSGCSTGSEGITTQGIGGATLLSRTRGSGAQTTPVATDFYLYQLNRRPPASFNVFYAGWNRTLTAPNPVFCFSHPCGDVMKFAIRSGSPTTTSLIDGSFNETFGTNYWRVNWTGNTATEGGSSGSALFDGSQRIIGQLLGGASFCSGASQCRSGGGSYVAGPDYYGTIGQSWNGGGTAATRLRDYLDPTNSNVQTLNGVNTPNPAPAGYCYSGPEDDTDSDIHQVTLGTLSVNTSGSGCSRYTDLTTNSVSLTSGQNYSLSVTRGTCLGNFGYTVKVFVDWNNDKDFLDAGEVVATNGPTSGAAALSTTVTVPASVVNGVSTIMRVVLREKLIAESDQQALDNTLPCDIFGWGETEDYTINLVNTTTSVEDAASGYNDPALDVFPNPAMSPVTVRWRIAQQQGPALVSIVSATGAASFAADLKYSESEGGYYLLLPSATLAAGSYSVRVLAGERQASKRLVIAR